MFLCNILYTPYGVVDIFRENKQITPSISHHFIDILLMIINTQINNIEGELDLLTCNIHILDLEQIVGTGGSNTYVIFY